MDWGARGMPGAPECVGDLRRVLAPHTFESSRAFFVDFGLFFFAFPNARACLRPDLRLANEIGVRELLTGAPAVTPALPVALFAAGVLGWPTRRRTGFERGRLSGQRAGNISPNRDIVPENGY
jgi:hypothetical protein